MNDQTKSTFARRVRAARPREKRCEIRDDIIPGVTLRIYPSGARSFALERTMRGKRRYARIGAAHAMTIPEARRLIAAFTETVRHDGGPRTPNGIDLVARAH